MKYLLSVFLTFGLLTNASFAAKSAGTEKAVAVISDDELSTYESHAEWLQAVVIAGQTAEAYKNDCAYSEAVLGLASGITKQDLQGAPKALSLSQPALAEKINTLVGQIKANIQVAQTIAEYSDCGNSGGGTTKNGKCCKTSGSADESDRCNSKASSDCKLVGRGTVKQCSATSDDC
ncbi:MAG: hypothetical protein J0L93_06360 [Deltaproteobacteria bacterium]|nr:hypothetical protein [Deltaproteobacteria bacterium]